MLYKWVAFDSKGGAEPPSLFRWGERLGVSQFLVRLLWRRGITSLKEMEVFLFPNLRYLPPLEDVPGLMDAASFIASSVEKQEKLAIWGDYDVDGITGCAVLFDFLRSRIGYEPRIYIPHRKEEGYGLNIEGIEKLYNEGIRLLVCVDCGISDVRAIERAKEMGIDVIITDHHLPGPDLPPADIIVNTKLGGEVYKNIAGVGVSFLLCAALNRILPGCPVDIRKFLDFVALGTIADVVLLDMENRILVKNGLLMLSESTRPGIVALKEVGGINTRSSLGMEEVGFILAPRINAAGRMAHAKEALELLLTRDIEEARVLAKRLESYNRERRKEEDRILKDALSQAEEEIKRENWGLVLCSNDWNQGVIGIVASRICEHFYRPTFLVTGGNEVLKGSGRSIPQVHLYKVLERCRGVLKRFGGHAQAGGISLSRKDMEEFKVLFSRAIKEELKGEIPFPTIEIEAKVPLDKVTYDLIKELQLLEPHGPGNPEPLFCSNPLRVNSCREFGDGHLSLELCDIRAKRTIWAKAWKKAKKFGRDLKGKEILVAFYPKISNFNGLLSLELHVRDLIELGRKGK